MTLQDEMRELRLELAVLRAENKALIEQREATRLWLAGYLVGSPIDPFDEATETLLSRRARYITLGRQVMAAYPNMKIQQIKELRTLARDMSLKEAKDIMDELWQHDRTSATGSPI